MYKKIAALPGGRARHKWSSLLSPENGVERIPFTRAFHSIPYGQKN